MGRLIAFPHLWIPSPLDVWAMAHLKKKASGHLGKSRGSQHLVTRCSGVPAPPCDCARVRGAIVVVSGVVVCPCGTDALHIYTYSTVNTTIHFDTFLGNCVAFKSIGIETHWSNLGCTVPFSTRSIDATLRYATGAWGLGIGGDQPVFVGVNRPTALCVSGFTIPNNQTSCVGTMGHGGTASVIFQY